MVALHLLIEPFGADLINVGQVGIQHDPVSPDQEDLAFDGVARSHYSLCPFRHEKHYG